MRRTSAGRRFPGTTAVLLTMAATMAGSVPASATPTELFFSEYVEGSSNNKALEIFNGTGASVDLLAGAYDVQFYFNGSFSAGTTIVLTGVVAAGDVYVVADDSAHADILAQADQVSTSNFFNGDDAVVLRKAGTIVDALGEIGFDPGTEWGTGLVSTQDNTLRRKGSVEAGDPEPFDDFDPALEWDGFAIDTFDGLGSHDLTVPVIADCDGPLVTTEGTPATATVTASDADSTVIDIEITSVTPDPAPGSITITAESPAPGIGGTATADVTVDGLTPEGTYDALITATNDDPTPQTGTCNLTVQVLGEATPIAEIQGSGDTSPLVGTEQTTTGIVTVILGSGLFIQDPAGDGDPATSEGLFLFTGSSTARNFSPGDEVVVEGTVTEFRPSSRPRDLTLTELSPVTAILTTDSGLPLPGPTVISDRPDEVISPDGIDAFERLEGMLVAIATPKVTGPTNFFGELVTVASGDHGNTTENGNLLLRPLPADQVDYNPERVMIDDEARLPGGSGSGTRINDPMTQVSVGDTATGDVTGAMDYQFSEYRVQANHLVADVLQGSRPPSPVTDLREAQPYEVRVATFNVLNLFDCVDDPGKEDDHPTCDDDDLAALETQLSKLALALELELDTPEVLIVEEIEKTEVLTGDENGFIPGTTIPALLRRIPSTAYDAISFDASDVRGIEVGLVFDTARVTLQDAYLATDVLPDPEGLFDGSGVYGSGREPLVGELTVDDIDLTVIGNHLKSKGGPQFGVDPTDVAGDDPLYGEFQPPTRWTEELRHKQADYVRDVVDLLIADGQPSILVGGDLNDFEFGEPNEGDHTVARITDSPTDPLANLVLTVPEEERYSFNFVGNSQALDHMLVTETLAALHNEQAFAHFNTNFPVTFEDDPTIAARASDHDPLVAWFCTDQTAPTLEVSVMPDELWPPNHKYRTVEATVTAADDKDPAVTIDLVSVVSNEPDDAPGKHDGNTKNDVVIVDDDTFRLRAERSSLGTGRVYTVTYRATDACGNMTESSATVEVPLEGPG
jgi:predicted extracellular nuclease